MNDDEGISVRIGGRELDPLRGGLLALVLGLAIAGYGAYDYQQHQQALADADEVNATVVATGVEAISGSSNPGSEYRPTVTFEYRYDGRNYTSGNVFPSATTPNYDTRSAAADVLSGYRAGDSVRRSGRAGVGVPDPPGVRGAGARGRDRQPAWVTRSRLAGQRPPVVASSPGKGLKRPSPER
jgi:hypothetical protein